MFKIDFVLPFDTEFDHSIWQWLLYAMFESDLNETLEYSLKRRMREYHVRNNKMYQKVKMNVNKQNGVYERNDSLPNYDGFQWRQSRGKRFGGKIKTFDVLNAWKPSERNFINNKNMLDNQLYALSDWIANADVVFYENF